ncbi:MAG: Gfo/Idh/MocA family oxidoreductase [Chitinophagaceae bacterium]
MKSILVIGFGAMGCRHVQSLLSHAGEYEIYVVEPSDDNIRTNTERIGATPDAFKRLRSLDELQEKIDVAIVATSSGPRFQIMKQLLEKGIKLFLLEKIVFQSASQFKQIIELMNKSGAKAYCNFVNRYFPAYNEVKEAIAASTSNCTMLVHGGEFGLGCNAIHYIDIFQYINGGRELQMNDAQLLLTDTANRRGSEYKEFTGAIGITDSNGNRLTIIAEKNFSGGITINIQCGDNQYVLSEQTQQLFAVSNDGVRVGEFAIIPTSRLTHTIVQDILSGKCRLTQVQETADAHALLFNSFNHLIYNSSDEKNLCPIT